MEGGGWWSGFGLFNFSSLCGWKPSKGSHEGSFFLPLSELSDLSNSNFFIFYFLTTKAKTTSLCLKIIKIKWTDPTQNSAESPVLTGSRQADYTTDTMACSNWPTHWFPIQPSESSRILKLCSNFGKVFSLLLAPPSCIIISLQDCMQSNLCMLNATIW